jgi:pSer/pThr/pTyr-binding forkhead associated (FHA) protein
MGTIPSNPPWIDPGTPSSPPWADSSAPTVAALPPDLPTLREPMMAPTAQAMLDRIEDPARLLLRSESGETLQEYILDKNEMVIGRAPTSDILLSKDKLTSRRHATIRYENGQYYLYDHHSANGTFVNGQQIEDTSPYLLHNEDHVGIGEHELVFQSPQKPAQTNIEEIPTQLVPFDTPPQDPTYKTRDDSRVTITDTDENEYGTLTMPEEPEEVHPPVSMPPVSTPPVSIPPVEEHSPSLPVEEPVYPVPPLATLPVPEEPPALPPTPPSSYPPVAPVPTPSYSSTTDGNTTFSRLTSLPQPVLPDISTLMAALSKLDGEIMSLQEQFNTTQEAMRNRDTELAKSASELRSSIRRVSDRMDNTIADVARSREALAWAELLQLMEDVMNNPRDIEYVTKLARKARELNKVFQIHQNVLNTMAECNSLLRTMIGDEN